MTCLKPLRCIGSRIHRTSQKFFPLRPNYYLDGPKAVMPQVSTNARRLQSGKFPPCINDLPDFGRGSVRQCWLRYPTFELSCELHP